MRGARGRGRSRWRKGLALFSTDRRDTDRRRRKRLPRLARLLPVFAFHAAWAAPPCASCHVNEAKTQVQTSMAHALLTPGNILPSHGKLAMRDGDYIYALERRNGQPTYTVTNGADTLAIPIRWAFGAKSQTY